MTSKQPAGDELLTPGGVAALLFVDPKTVTRWAMAGKLAAIRTPGGHRRYLKSDVMAIRDGLHPQQDSRPDPTRIPSQGTSGAVAGDPDREAAAAAVVAEASTWPSRQRPPKLPRRW